MQELSLNLLAINVSKPLTVSDEIPNCYIVRHDEQTRRTTVPNISVVARWFQRNVCGDEHRPSL